MEGEGRSNEGTRKEFEESKGIQEWDGVKRGSRRGTAEERRGVQGRKKKRGETSTMNGDAMVVVREKEGVAVR